MYNIVGTRTEECSIPCPVGCHELRNAYVLSTHDGHEPEIAKSIRMQNQPLHPGNHKRNDCDEGQPDTIVKPTKNERISLFCLATRLKRNANVQIVRAELFVCFGADHGSDCWVDASPGGRLFVRLAEHVRIVEETRFFALLGRWQDAS